MRPYGMLCHRAYGSLVNLLSCQSRFMAFHKPFAEEHVYSCVVFESSTQIYRIIYAQMRLHSSAPGLLRVTHPYDRFVVIFPDAEPPPRDILPRFATICHRNEDAKGTNKPSTAAERTEPAVGYDPRGLLIRYRGPGCRQNINLNHQRQHE